MEGFEVVINVLYTINCLSKYFSGNFSNVPVQQQIHKMLGEVLDGSKSVRVEVVTPYFYTVGE